MRSPNIPPTVTPLLDALLPAIRDALPDNLVGIYLRGSIALGGFDAETSDVDLTVVTESPVSETEFERLAELHARVPARENEFGRTYEVSYVDRGSIRRFGDDERIHPTVGADWSFARAPHPDNFVVERWVTREHGVVLEGPDPKTLIDPISANDLRVAVRNELTRHMVWVDAAEPPDWLSTRHYQAFAIETMCRALYTLATGSVTTKRLAVEWAIGSLPERWRLLAEWSHNHHADKTADEAKVSEVMEFIRWVASQRVPPTVTPLIDALLPLIREALGENFVGAYLAGSIATGAFDPESSDVDLLVVTEGVVSHDELGVLKVVHDRLPAVDNVFGVEYEVYYIDRGTLRRFAEGQTHVKVSFDEPLYRTKHRSNWVVERHIVREHGITLAGPEPKSLIDPVSLQDIREAVLAELTGRLVWWTDGTWPPEELWHRGAQGYEVETVCRALCTIETGELLSKREAIEWGLRALPEEWHALLEWSQENRRDWTRDKAKVDEVLALVRYAVGRASMAAE